MQPANTGSNMQFIELLRRLKSSQVVHGFEWVCEPHPTIQDKYVMGLVSEKQSVSFILLDSITDAALEEHCDVLIDAMLAVRFQQVINLMRASGTDPRKYLEKYMAEHQ